MNVLSIKVADEIVKRQAPPTSPKDTTLQGDVIVGWIGDYVKTKALVEKPFMSTLQPFVAPASTLITSLTCDFPRQREVLKTPEGYTREIRHMIFRFNPSWFDTVIKNAATRSAFINGTAKISEISEEVLTKINKSITDAKNFYKPVGRIFTICSTGTRNEIDGIVGLSAITNGHTIIQINNDGPAKLGSFDATDEKVAELFAKRIGAQLKANSYFSTTEPVDMNKELSPNTVYSFPTQIGKAKKSKPNNKNKK